MPISLRRQLALGGLVLLLAGLFVGGEQPGAGNLFPVPWDKVAHVLAYAAVGALVALSFPALSLPAVLFVVAAVGAADEVHQLFLPGRQAGIDDWLADLLGGAGVLLVIPRLRQMYVSLLA